MTFPFPVNPPDAYEHHTLGVHIPAGGIELQLDIGMNLYVYRHPESGVFVVELVTIEHLDEPRLPDDEREYVEHNEDGVPKLRVYVNECVVSDYGSDV